MRTLTGLVTLVLFVLINSIRFDGWLRLIDGYRGVDYGYLNPEGIIPEASVIAKGQERMMDTEDIEDAQADDREG
jgi:hypothetical protein